MNTFTIFREEATIALAGVHAGPLSWSNWISQCWFLLREENWRTWRKKPSEQGREQKQTLPTFDNGQDSNPGRIDRRRTLSPVRHPCSVHRSISCCVLLILTNSWLSVTRSILPSQERVFSWRSSDLRSFWLVMTRKIWPNQKHLTDLCGVITCISIKFLRRL